MSWVSIWDEKGEWEGYAFPLPHPASRAAGQYACFQYPGVVCERAG